MKSTSINFVILSITMLLVALLSTACNSGEATEMEVQQEEETHEENIVTLTEAQMNAVGIETGPLVRHSLGVNVEVNGTLEVPPQNEARVSAYLGGNVKEILVIEGDKVEQGQVLAYLEHPDLITLQQNYQEALSRLAFLQTEYEREKRLYKEEIGSGQAFQKAKAEYMSVKSRIAALEAKLKMLNLNAEAIAGGKIYQAIPVKAPIEGSINKVEVVIGQYVAPQQELFEIVDNDHVHADFMVYEQNVAKVGKGQKVIFTVANRPGKELSATIYSVSATFEDDPKAVHVHAEIENEKGQLIPGMYVQGRIVTDTAKTWALPESAVVKEGGRSYIFVLTEGEPPVGQSFRMMEVGTGVTEAGLVEIKPLGDLPNSIRVATKGAYYLLAEMKKGEAGHHH